jgi:hypothetical protein
MKRKIEFPFDENDISSLLFLEENYIDNPNEKTIVTQLVEKYAALIEYYDSQKDPIKLYFMDKMQSTVFKFNKSKEKAEAESFLGNIKKINQKNTNLPKKSIEFKPMQKYEKELSSGKQLFDIRKAKREGEHFLYSKFQKENEEGDTKLKKKLNEFDKKSENNTELIKTNLDLQKNSIRSKLKERRERSIEKSLERSMNKGKSQNSFSKNKDFERTFDNKNILKNIDNEYYG